jgi:uncharacterized protein (DUF433 family)
MALNDRIIVDSEVLTGKPVIRGTRISVELVVELLAAGWSAAQILASYPHLTDEDIQACLVYAKSYPLQSA